MTDIKHVHETAEATPIMVPGHWIAGAVVPGDGADLDIVSPVNGRLVATVPLGSADTVDQAVAAARAASPTWAATTPAARAAIVRRLAEELTARSEDVAQAVSTEIGVPITFARLAQAGFPPFVTAAMADVAEEFEWEEQVAGATLVREPVGVVGAITPWNFPLQQVITKVVPAMLAGNTVVLKPAELAPLTGPILAEATAAAGIPAGVLNIVYGTGPVVGEAIATHPGVDMISFTGSTAAGKRVAAVAAGTVKKVALELGGKTANIVLDDADLEHAIPETLKYAWSNSGQACGAWTRLLIPASRHDEIMEKLVAAAKEYTLGDPSDEDTRLGPVASEAQWQRVNGYIEQGLAEGADLVFGGPGRVEGLEQGAFIRPTIFANVEPDSTIAQEEIFGPVLSVIDYDDDDDAVRIANGTQYGLTASVFGTPDRALAIARRLEVGQVHVNGASFTPLAPFGGRKQSGRAGRWARPASRSSRKSRRSWSDPLADVTRLPRCRSVHVRPAVEGEDSDRDDGTARVVHSERRRRPGRDRSGAVASDQGERTVAQRTAPGRPMVIRGRSALNSRGGLWLRRARPSRLRSFDGPDAVKWGTHGT
ncbi:aldehyde dehydrogenase family protein [Nocardioides conyzicola]|uniref:Aldehyde dehydrogenase family protein n=1 Tax=Nocardioides conyzicola TaxID=1651781 RepID=A0ABP8Y1M1_9ACTN